MNLFIGLLLPLMQVAPIQIPGVSFNLPTHQVQIPDPRVVIFNDGLLKIVAADPIYPFQAREHGLEGWVTVTFDVLATGVVANVRVVESSNRLFENTSVKAASKFKYKPRTVDGRGVRTNDITHTFTFMIDEVGIEGWGRPQPDLPTIPPSSRAAWVCPGQLAALNASSARPH